MILSVTYTMCRSGTAVETRFKIKHNPSLVTIIIPRIVHLACTLSKSVNVLLHNGSPAELFIH